MSPRRRVVVKVRGLAVVLVGIAFASGLCREAHAADHQTIADVRCVVVAMHIVASNTTMNRAAGMMIAMYYFGRLDGRSPGADIERLIEREAGKMTLADLRANAARCGKTFEEKSHEFARIGTDLAHQGQEGAIKKNRAGK